MESIWKKPYHPEAGSTKHLTSWVKMAYLLSDLKKGLAGGALALGISFLLRTYSEGVFLPELAALTLFSSVSGEIQSQAVENLGVLAKYSAFLGAVAVNLILYGLVGMGLLRIKNVFAGRKYASRSFLFSLISYVLFVSLSLAFFSLTEIITKPTSVTVVLLTLLPPNLAFGFTIGVSTMQPRMEKPLLCEPDTTGTLNLKRRVFIKRGATAAAAFAILAVGLSILFNQQKPSTSSLKLPPAPVGQLTGLFADERLSRIVSSEVTPNSEFYKVQIDIFDPTVDANTWKLRLKGSVKNPIEYSYAEITGMADAEQYTTLECVSNEVSGDLIGNAKWKGVPLRKILEKAVVNSTALYVVFKCADGYSVGIPLDKALTDGTILAYEMNGERLPVGHGFPLRAIVPGIYGMMNAKWITELEVVDSVYEGFWQRRGWTNDAKIQTTSIVKIPSHLQTINGATPIAGIAFSGDRGISKVEVSTDGGVTWGAASVKDPLSGYTWVLWAAEWMPNETGVYKILVRATDELGNVQTAQVREPFPAGATGYHAIDVKVNAV